MDTKRLYLMVSLLVIGCLQIAVSQDKPALPAKEVAAEAELDPQLKIIRDALLKGSVEAATVMVLSDNPQARRILLDALKQPENSTARVAVCKALSQMWAAQKPVTNKEDFIPPLLDVLAADDSTTAKLAAEATLIFNYDQIQEPLERMAADVSLPAKARLNAVYALRLHPDMRAIFKLMDLLDDSEGQVAAAVEKALHSLGIPVEKDAEARQEITDELERGGPEAFLRYRLIRRETEIRKLEAELNLWRQRYWSALDKIYDTISDDAARSQFLAGHLGNSEPMVKLWALEVVRKDRVGTRPNPRLPADIGPTLVNLISDQDRDVRLRTARLLPLMGELNPAQRLLAQLEVEQDDEVKMELFVALGYTFLPDPKVKIPDQIRKETIVWAVKYLAEKDAKKAQKGAEVMKKLLEQDGLDANDVGKYLDLLVARYEREKNSSSGTLRGELLSAMAGLCAPRSVCKVQSAKLFAPLFEPALADETELVRQAAIDGFIYIDKAAALKRLRKDFVNDPSIIIRRKLTELAGEVGGQEDLVWLADKIGVTGESQPAWQALLTIFKRSGADLLSEWAVKFDSQSKFSDEQRIAFLEVAEQKAVSENKPEMRKNIRAKLAELYRRSGQFERAAEYLGLLREAAQTTEERQAILVDLLDTYLRWPKLEHVAKLVENCLLEKDLEPNNVIIRSIDNYLTNPANGADPDAVLAALCRIEVKNPETRPLWAQQLRRWADRFGQALDADKPEDSAGWP